MRAELAVMIGLVCVAAATAQDVRAAATEGLPAKAPEIVVYDATVEVTAATRLALIRAARQAAPTDLRWQAEELRALYFLAIEEEAWLAEAEAAARALGARPDVGAAVGVTAAAYLGALETLRAKHAFWPMRKLRHLEDGLAALAAAIAEDPRHVEARYLRLMSCYWLPGFLGRGDLVFEDFAALTPLLAQGPGNLPVDLWVNTVRFVLDKAPALDDARRSDLAAALDRWSTERAS